MQMQSTIEYNEWKFGERKEAIVSSMRAMAAKWGNAIQQGLVYGTLAISGLYSLTQSISNYENSLNALGAENAEVQAKYDEMIATLSGATSNQLLILGVGMIIVPMLLMLTTIFLCGVVFKIDEKKYNEIIQDLAKRKKRES